MAVDLLGPPTKSRSLNISQTIDELLGLPKKDSAVDRNSLSSPARPPTRHGRESTSSSEENRDLSTNSIIATESWRIDDDITKTTSKKDPDNGSDEDFLTKLNEMRRRSLVMSKDVRENQISRKPSQIKEETEDESNSNLKNEKHVTNVVNRLSSRPPTSESVAHTFRITLDKEANGKRGNHIEISKKRSQSAEKVPLTAKKQQLTSSLLASGKGTHDKWLKRKAEEEREKRRKRKEMEEAKIRIENEKKEQSRILFERWKADRNEKDRILAKERRTKEKAKLAIEEDRKKEKKLESEKNFDNWVKKRSQSISARLKKVKEVGEKKKEQTELERKEKLKEAQKTFEAWKAQKLITENQRKQEIEEKRSIEMEKRKAEKEYKELLAQEAFTTWLELKERERELKQNMNEENIESEQNSLPWLPPSNTCPRQFVSSGKNRRRSLERRPRAISAQVTRMQRATSLKSILSMK